MAVDKEALICLSRVYSYYFKCNFPLFYVYPALTRYLSILFLNIFTLLACTHSSDNLFHTLMVLCENENFLTSNLITRYNIQTWQTCFGRSCAAGRFVVEYVSVVLVGRSGSVVLCTAGLEDMAVALSPGKCGSYRQILSNNSVSR